MVSSNPFGNKSMDSDVVRFVSVLAKRPRVLPSLPLSLPADGAWLLRILATENRFVFGMYRRHMKTIRYLSMIDTLFWSTCYHTQLEYVHHDSQGAREPSFNSGSVASPSSSFESIVLYRFIAGILWADTLPVAESTMRSLAEHKSDRPATPAGSNCPMSAPCMY